MGPLICSTSPSSNGMQSLRDLSHLEIIFQKAQSRISMVLFVAHNPHVKKVESSNNNNYVTQDTCFHMG